MEPTKKAKTLSRKEIVAWLIDAPYDSFMAYIDLGAEGVRVVGPDGRKHVFSAEQLGKGEQAMGMTEKLKDVVQAVKAMQEDVNQILAKPAPAPKAKPKPSTKPKTRPQAKKPAMKPKSKSSGK